MIAHDYYESNSGASLSNSINTQLQSRSSLLSDKLILNSFISIMIGSFFSSIPFLNPLNSQQKSVSKQSSIALITTLGAPVSTSFFWHVSCTHYLLILDQS